MTEIQKTLFTLLCEVDGICRKYGITYFLHENTALEAVQKDHMGEERMIAEVIMRVPELLRFMEAFEKEKPAHRSLESWLNEPRYGDFGCHHRYPRRTPGSPGHRDRAGHQAGGARDAA